MIRIIGILASLSLIFPQANLALGTDPPAPLEDKVDDHPGGRILGDHPLLIRPRGGELLGLVPLLRVESIRKELKLDNEQTTVVEELSVSIREDLGVEIHSFLRSLRNTDHADRANSRKRIKEIRERINQRIQTVLTEEQFQRLNQIGLQLDLRKTGAAETLTSEELTAALDLDEEQVRLLQQHGADARSKGEQEKPLSLGEARGATKDILTQEQQERLDTLIGPEFDLPKALLQKDAKHPRGGRKAFEGRRKRILRRDRPGESELGDSN